MRFSDHVKDIKPDYEFETINPKEYHVEFFFAIEGWYLQKMFNKSMKRFGQDGRNISQNEIEVPPYYLTALRAMTKKWARQVNNGLKKDDGMNMLSYNVLRANFIKDKVADMWKVHVHGYGEYESTIIKKEEKKNG